MNRFNLSMAACALAFVTATPTFAADMPGGYRPAYVAPAAGWSGVYAGLNGAYGWGQSDWSGGVTTGTNSPAGGLFGATLGLTRNPAHSSLVPKVTSMATGCAIQTAVELAFAARPAAQSRPAGLRLRVAELATLLIVHWSTSPQVQHSAMSR